MTLVRTLMWIACALVAPLMSTGSAHAVFRSIPETTTATYVGMVSGDAWMAHLRPAGCLWTKLGAGGLQDNNTIYGVVGADNQIFAVSTTTTVCGFSMSPLTTNGWWMTFIGRDGKDILVGSIKAATFGGHGHDITWTDRPSASNLGGPGNDTLYSSTSTVQLLGEGGDDSLCTMASGSRVKKMDGGSHTNGIGDTACGSADEYVGIENNNTPSHCPAACAAF